MTTTPAPAPASQPLAGPFTIAAEALSLLSAGGDPRPKMVYDADGKTTTQQQKDDHGTPLWTVEVYDASEEANASPVRVTIASAVQPEPIARFKPVRLAGPVLVRPYVQAGRISYAVKAGGIRPA